MMGVGEYRARSMNLYEPQRILESILSTQWSYELVEEYDQLRSNPGWWTKNRCDGFGT